MLSKPRAPSRPVASLRNLGPKSAMMLAAAGIASIDELEQLGAVKAYLRVKSFNPKFASLNLLWALAAGLADRDWRELTAADKARLKAEVMLLRR